MLISQVQAAELLGVSRRAIDRKIPDLLGLGVAVRDGEGGRIRYEAESLPAAWLELAEPQARNAEQLKKLAEKVRQEGAALAKELGEDAPPDDQEVPPWHVSRARLEHYKAEREEIALKRTRGELLDREAVERSAFEAGRRLRDAFQRFAVHLPPRMKHCASMAEQTILIQSMCHELLTDLSNGHRSAIDQQVAKQQREATK